jgi:glycosyltransferase involved in cell wall biosynthesis
MGALSAGISSYIKQLAPALCGALRAEGRHAALLADTPDGSLVESEMGGMLVLRCWRRNSLFYWAQIIRALRTRMPQARTVLIQFEFNMFGGVAATGTFPLLLVLLRLTGRRACVMMHQAVGDLAEVRTHAGLRDRPISFAVFRRLTKVFYRLVLLSASAVLVHEPLLKERLLRGWKRPVAVIPHGVRETGSAPDRASVRVALRFGMEDFILLSFGFLTHYKGSDWAVDEIVRYAEEPPQSPVRLVLAGGESPNHCEKPHYRQFVSDLLVRAAQRPGRVTVTGFVPEDQCGMYFGAADLVIFPYRAFMSASGPLALALSYGAPFLLSTPLEPMLQCEDFQEALAEQRLTSKDLTFNLRHGALVEKAAALSADPGRLATMRAVSRAVGRKRNWRVVAREYLRRI